MEWSEIIVVAAGVITSLDLTRLIFFRSNRKKAAAEADTSAQEPLIRSLAELRTDIQTYREKNDALEDKLDKVEAEKDALHQELLESREEGAVVKGMMCIHGACPLRDPLRGMGSAWIESHKDDMSLGMDNLPLEVLLDRNNKRLKEIMSTEE